MGKNNLRKFATSWYDFECSTITQRTSYSRPKQTALIPLSAVVL